MRLASRSFALGLFVTLLGGAASLALGLVGCGTDAVGIDVCRQIEGSRCVAAQQCGFTQAQTDACTNFYRDQCLTGIENEKAPEDTAVVACLDAVKATEACAQAQTPTMAACAGATLVASADASAVTPCDIILHGAELLAACSFVTKPPASDAGAPPVVDSGANDAATD